MNRRLIVGLGNPGPDYVLTRHNIGFCLIDRLVSHLVARPVGSFPAFDLWSHVRPSGEVYLMKPTTFMNLSGRALIEFVQLCPIDTEYMLIAFDDVSLPLGTIRLRPTGSGGSHRGMNHIIEQFATKSIPRIRLGIDGPHRGDLRLRDYVLKPFDQSEMTLFDRVIDHAAQAVRAWLDQDMNRVMGEFNGAVPQNDLKTGTAPAGTAPAGTARGKPKLR